MHQDGWGSNAIESGGGTHVAQQDREQRPGQPRWSANSTKSNARTSDGIKLAGTSNDEEGEVKINGRAEETRT